MLPTLLLSPIIAGPIWPGLALVVVVLLPLAGLGLLVRGSWLLSKAERSASWLTMRLARLLASWLLSGYLEY